MMQLVLFGAAFAAVAVFDVRGMRKIGLQKELWLYAALALVSVILAVRYFPEMHRRSIMSIILKLFRIEW
ncbi:MAG: hypothetical protein LBN00_05065 [Oscillospiraceae bacterium]|jgi:hypothetical protein|nr:hypothetical protein [Oscillospiraceae bacterium]